jgi:AcrR family transcriptional regulator
VRTHSTRSPDAPARTFPAATTLRSDKRERRDRIIAAAQALMLDVDYERIQVKDVAERAGVSLGTLYRYFNSKEHLFASVLLAWSSSFGEHLDQSTTGPTLDNVKAVYRRAARAFERQPRVYAVLIQVQGSADPHAREVFREFAQRQSGAFASAFDSSRLSDEKRRDVIAVMNAVLDENLRAWQLGLQPVSAVATAIDRAAELILGR